MNAQAGADFVFGGLPQQKIFAFYVSMKSVINHFSSRARLFKQKKSWVKQKSPRSRFVIVT